MSIQKQKKRICMEAKLRNKSQSNSNLLSHMQGNNQTIKQ